MDVKESARFSMPGGSKWTGDVLTLCVHISTLAWFGLVQHSAKLTTVYTI